MATAKRDGRHIITDTVETLNRLHDELPSLSDQLEAGRIPDWQARMKALVDDTPLIMKKLFLKTQGGTMLAQKSLNQAKALDRLIREGIQDKSPAEATQAVEEAIQSLEKELGAFIHKAKTHVIRMT